MAVAEEAPVVRAPADVAAAGVVVVVEVVTVVTDVVSVMVMTPSRPKAYTVVPYSGSASVACTSVESGEDESGEDETTSSDPPSCLPSALPTLSALPVPPSQRRLSGVHVSWGPRGGSTAG